MLIIFDLDDTLIDTSGSIVPQQLKRVVFALKKGGLAIHDEKQAALELLSLDRQSLYGQEAIYKFLEKYGGCQKHFHIAENVLYKTLPLSIDVQPRKKAISILKKLYHTHSLALVTWGSKSIQKRKMEKAGIDCSLFSKIVMATSPSKGIFYQTIVEELRFLSSDVYVCGDRYELDLKPAKELGYRTILMKWGRGKIDSCFDHWVDHVIHEVEEVLNFL